MNEETEQSEMSDEQKALCRKLSKRLERALKQQKDDKKEEKYKRYRKYVRGDVGGDDDPGLVRTNIIHSNFAAIIPQIYAKNPEIAVSPSEAAGDQAPWVPGFCKTLQSVLNRVFINDAKLKKRAKASIRSAMTTSLGWVKVLWQQDVRTDPIIQNRISDTQDNLQRIRMLIDEIQEGDESRCELEAKQAELEQQLSALQQQAEVSAVSGIAIDRVMTEDMFILDDTIQDTDQYEQAEALAHRVWMTEEQYKQQFGKDCPQTATKYGSDKKENSGAAEENKVRLVAVFEVWSKQSNTVYTLCNGADEWARDPYVPLMSKRFYPFFALYFNPVDGRMEPLSDVELLIELQDEYNTTRTNFAEHRKENLPVRVYRKGGDLTDRDVNALANRQANQWVGIEGNPDSPIEKDIAVLPNPPVDPATYDVSPILRDAEMVLGAGDASKGTINKVKTATEAEIMAQGLQSRVAERQDVVEDWIAEMANYSAELCLQSLSQPQVQGIAGVDAVWPQMDKTQIFDLVSIEIRAGSAGRPNKAKEREQWGQMLPQIQQAITQVMELRKNGQNDMAETVMKLLEETLRRFDERIDIESFLPQKQEGEEKPTIPPEIQQQFQQMQEVLQQLQAENQQLQQQASGNAEKMAFEREKLDFEMKRAGAQIEADKGKSAQDADVRLQEAQIKANADAQAKVEAERIRADLERDRLASQERTALQTAMIQAMTQRQNAQESARNEAASQQQQQQGQQDMTAMLENMQQAMQSMAQTFAQAMDGFSTRMAAPRMPVYDEAGNIIRIETVQ